MDARPLFRRLCLAGSVLPKRHHRVHTARPECWNGAGQGVGLLAQGLTAEDAAALGVYLHGKAGERVRDSMGDAGMIATDLLPVLPVVVKRLKEDKQSEGEGLCC